VTLAYGKKRRTNSTADASVIGTRRVALQCLLWVGVASTWTACRLHLETYEIQQHWIMPVLLVFTSYCIAEGVASGLVSESERT
jgi:hypothetical protein